MPQGRAQWSQIVPAVGGAGVLLGVPYVVGTAVLSLRYVGFGLSGQRTSEILGRDYAFFAGVRSLAIWGAIGVALAVALRATIEPRAAALRGALAQLPRALATRPAPVRRAARAALAIALAAALAWPLHVWWPLVAAAAVAGLALVHVLRPAGAVAQAAAVLLATTAIAVAYEADRLSFGVERVTLSLARGADVPAIAGTATASPDALGCVRRPGRLCGLFVAHDGDGLYVMVAGGTAATGRRRLVFVPAGGVAGYALDKMRAHVPPASAAARRRPLLRRVADLVG